MTYPWFRMYHEFAGDPVIQALAFDDQRHFVMALCLKATGFLDRDMPSPEFRHRAICKALGLDPVAGADALRRLREVGLVDGNWHPVAWDRRQFKSDNSTARVQKFRATHSQKEEELNPLKTETEGNVSGNVSETLQTPPKKKTQASRIPEGWQPSDSLIAYAEQQLPNVDAERLAEAFTDYWRAAAGEKARKVDWDATWRTWVRRSGDRYPMKRQPARAEKQIRIDANGRQISG